MKSYECPLSDVHATLTKIRKDERVSQKSTALDAGIGPATLANSEAGRFPLSVRGCAQIARALGFRAVVRFERIESE